jgi:ribonuclease Z
MHAQLVNGRSGDPVVAVDTLFTGRLILFDLGDLASLPTRKLLRVSDVFVSHAHIDHFFGFDRLLRLLLGREKTVRLWGPRGFIDRVGHRLRSYEWNLVGEWSANLVFVVTEVLSATAAESTCFRVRTAFASEPRRGHELQAAIIHSEPRFRVSAAWLAHGSAISLGYAIEESRHLNVWKNKLEERGLVVGPWLKQLKQAVLEERAPGTPIALGGGETRTLAELHDTFTVTRGQKIAYVTDVSDTAANRRAIIDLARGADTLFIEANFAAEDQVLAAERGHLTTRAAGEIARAAQVARIEPFHFSARYAGEDDRMLCEVINSFAGAAAA